MDMKKALQVFACRAGRYVLFFYCVRRVTFAISRFLIRGFTAVIFGGIALSNLPAVRLAVQRFFLLQRFLLSCSGGLEFFLRFAQGVLDELEHELPLGQLSAVDFLIAIEVLLDTLVEFLGYLE